MYYNRFRYYDSNSGNYISQDPIGINGKILNLYGYVIDSNVWLDQLGLRIRGNQATRNHIEDVKTQFLADNPSSHIGGGLDKNGISVKETYIPPTNKIPGSTKGGSYADLTFKSPYGQVVHINTVNKGSYMNSGMSQRKYINAKRIQTDAPNSIVITV